MDIIGTILLALLIVAPAVYVIAGRVLEKRRIKEAGSVESSADSAPVDVTAPELDTLSAASYLKTSAGSAGVAATGRRETKAAAAERSGARPATASRAATTRARGLTYSLSRIERLPPLKRAIVWSELLKPPPGIDPTSTDPHR